MGENDLKHRHPEPGQTQSIAIGGDENSEGTTAREKVERGWSIKHNGRKDNRESLVTAAPITKRVCSTGNLTFQSRDNRPRPSGSGLTVPAELHQHLEFQRLPH